MKYLFLFLLLTACATPRAETKKEAKINPSPEAFIPKTKEDLDKLRTPVSSYEVLNRLMKTEIAYSIEGKSLSYRVIYFDPQDYKYYFGMVAPIDDLISLTDTIDFNNISKNTLEDERRLASFSNLSPSQRLYIDTRYYPEQTNLFIETIRKTPDPYYIYVNDSGEQTMMNIFTDDSGQILPTNLTLAPTTNEVYGKVSYEAIINGKPNFNYAFYRDSDTGDIMGFTYLFPWLSWEEDEEEG